MTLTADQFVTNLLGQTLTPERVAKVMARIAGTRIEVGPLPVGPGGAITASGVGLIGTIDVAPVPGDGLAFTASVPAQLTFDLALGSAKKSYQGTVGVPLAIQLLLEPPAAVFLQVSPLLPSEVTVKLMTEGIDAFVLQSLGHADDEVAEQVAKVVNQRVAEVAGLRRIDLADLVDRSWDEAMEARLSP